MLFCLFVLASCSEEGNIGIPPVHTSIEESVDGISTDEPKEVALKALENLLLLGNKSLDKYFQGETTNNVIGVFNEDLPVVELAGNNTSFNAACKEIYWYAPEILRLEFRRYGYEIVGDKIGRVWATGENGYFIEDGNITNRASTFNLVHQDEIKIVISVDCYSDTSNDPEPYEYTFDITDENNPILVDISGYGLQNLKDERADTVTNKTLDDFQ